MGREEAAKLRESENERIEREDFEERAEKDVLIRLLERHDGVKSLGKKMGTVAFVLFLFLYIFLEE